MPLRRVLAAAPLAALCLAGAAVAARGYPDPAGDVPVGSGPDIVAVTLSHTRTTLTFRVRFASAPPLGLSARERWVDMLLVGIDVPPLGPAPAGAGAGWRGADFALGTHGPAKTGRMVRLGEDVPEASRDLGSVAVVTRGRTVALTIPRRRLGGAAWFAFSLAAGREGGTETGSGDLAPARGTFRYVLAV